MSTDSRDRRPVSDDPEAALREQRALERRAFLRQAGIIGLAAAGSAWAGLAPSHWPLSLKDPDGDAAVWAKRFSDSMAKQVGGAYRSFAENVVEAEMAEV